MINNNHNQLENGNSQPIGIFDSGLGGLSIAQCINQQLPHEHFIYIADTFHAPYGDKPAEFIQRRVNVIADKLIKLECKAIVVACNTATVNAIDQLRTRLSTPIIGVEPAIKPAALISKSKNIGLLVTQATANNARFIALVKRFSQNVNVIIQPCPGLVELIEQGQINSETCDELLRTYLTPLIEKQVDTLVLGCTHYPFLLNKIIQITQDKMRIMETALPVTQQLTRILQQHDLSASPKQDGLQRFISSKSSPEIEAHFSTLWGKNIRLESFD